MFECSSLCKRTKIVCGCLCHLLFHQLFHLHVCSRLCRDPAATTAWFFLDTWGRSRPLTTPLGVGCHSSYQKIWCSEMWCHGHRVILFLKVVLDSAEFGAWGSCGLWLTHFLRLYYQVWCPSCWVCSRAPFFPDQIYRVGGNTTFVSSSEMQRQQAMSLQSNLEECVVELLLSWLDFYAACSEFYLSELVLSWPCTAPKVCQLLDLLQKPISFSLYGGEFRLKVWN